jgi:hypothetical protein
MTAGAAQEVGGRAKALDQRDGAAVALVGLELGAGQQMLRNHALHHLRSGIGSDSTHCRTGTCGMT